MTKIIERDPNKNLDDIEIQIQVKFFDNDREKTLKRKQVLQAVFESALLDGKEYDDIRGAFVAAPTKIIEQFQQTDAELWVSRLNNYQPKSWKRYVGDNFRMLLTHLTVFVTNIKYHFTHATTSRNVTKKSNLKFFQDIPPEEFLRLVND